ncbi:gelsolin-like protein 2 [Aplysia californica]|uniref:Gelsolin-like protein 2 n=1 Tax=Aplysia californica TaxID=6500 RepID=A0ABM0JZW3_APLCA|nr:gelsolin-like protein 2 [Aplysia californica]XP_005105455.1 gelsolin-like protein 2 [Aplysia californica]XP_005105456.1 gelsolin-like protein 2 [Aplysia californica]XP_005105458.1 gelsolin-like protein 2 [Aplysia californica]
MSGLVKAKKYDWKDSNLALFGSDTEKEVKKESAEQEPAWQGAGAEPGLKIWRIVDFKVTEWPEDDYGEFYNGDSYIILNTYKDEETENLLHDVHFWIGKNSSQDEYGTAAYKTVELDTFLDDVPIQHREVQGHESALFRSYFEDGITLKEGGAASGFRHVPAEEYTARLFRYARDKHSHIVLTQLPRAASLVTEGDVFILDCGLKIYQYNGDDSSPMERSKAMQYVSKLKSQRGEADSDVLDGSSTSKSHEFWEKLDEEEGDSLSDDEDGPESQTLLKVNTETKDSEVVKEGDLTKDDLAADDVFIVDSGDVVFVWVGENASSAEKKNGIPYAHNYLRESGQPWRPITVVKQGQKCPQFESAIAA